MVFHETCFVLSIPESCGLNSCHRFGLPLLQFRHRYYIRPDVSHMFIIIVVFTNEGYSHSHGTLLSLCAAVTGWLYWLLCLKWTFGFLLSRTNELVLDRFTSWTSCHLGTGRKLILYILYSACIVFQKHAWYFHQYHAHTVIYLNKLFTACICYFFWQLGHIFDIYKLKIKITFCAGLFFRCYFFF